MSTERIATQCVHPFSSITISESSVAKRGTVTVQFSCKACGTPLTKQFLGEISQPGSQEKRFSTKRRGTVDFSASYRRSVRRSAEQKKRALRKLPDPLGLRNPDTSRGVILVSSGDCDLTLTELLARSS
jgi:hypothetical protein